MTHWRLDCMVCWLYDIRQVRCGTVLTRQLRE